MNNQICGLNYLDVIIRKGAIPLGRLGSTFPFTMGVEAAGIVEKIGDKVDGVAVGERVAYVVIGSGEYVMFTHSRKSSEDGGTVFNLCSYRDSIYGLKPS